MSRQKGAINRDTKQLRAFVDEFLMGSAEQLREDFNALDPKDRINLFTQLLKYRLPRLNAVSVEDVTPVKPKTVDLSSLSTEELGVMLAISDKMGVEKGEEIDFKINN